MNGYQRERRWKLANSEPQIAHRKLFPFVLGDELYHFLLNVFEANHKSKGTLSVWLKLI